MNSNINSISSAIPYKGRATIKIRIKDKIIEISNHNNAQFLLKKMFVQFMTGNILGEYNASAKVPQFIDITKQDGANWNSVLVSPVPISSREYVYEDNIWVGKLTAVVQAGNLIEDSITEDSTYRLELLANTNNLSDSEKQNSSNKGILASMEDEGFDESVLSTIVPGTSGIFEWQLQLVDVEE